MTTFHFVPFWYTCTLYSCSRKIPISLYFTRIYQ